MIAATISTPVARMTRLFRRRGGRCSVAVAPFKGSRRRGILIVVLTAGAQELRFPRRKRASCAQNGGVR
jgi:hypothetical protein